MGWVATIFGIILGGSILRTADAASVLRAIPENVEFVGFSGGVVKFRLILKVQNPSGKSIAITYVFAGIKLGTKEIANIDLGVNNLPPELRQTLIIEGNSSKKITVPFEIPLMQLGLSLGSQVLSFVTSGFELAKLLPNTAGVEGYIKANGLRSNFVQTVQLLKQPQPTA